MSEIKIRFLCDGCWSDEPGKPNFEVKEGDEREVTARLANIAVSAGKAEFVVLKPEPEVQQEPEAQQKKKPGPKPKAESKPYGKAEG